MEVPNASVLLKRVRSLPAGGQLLERLGDAEGVHLVGGAVRDLLIGGTPSDLDLVVEGDAADFAARLGGSLRLHDRFGTSTVVVGGFIYDIARARRETYPRPGALPEVTPASLAEDLPRRDFTVNAAAIVLGGRQAGELIASTQTLDDLEARRLRVLHERSFVEDPTRLLRLARYAGALRFEIEAHTRELALEAVKAGALASVSGARIGAELRLLLRQEDPIAALQSLRELGLDTALEPGFGVDDPELGRRALELLGGAGRRDRLALALATRSLPAARLVPMLDHFAFEAADRDAIADAVARAQTLLAPLQQAERPAQIAALLSGASPELVALVGALGPARAAGQWLKELRHVRLQIDGDDLLAAGVPRGPAIGRGLRAALAAKLDGRVSGREQELAEALRAAR